MFANIYSLDPAKEPKRRIRFMYCLMFMNVYSARAHFRKYGNLQTS